MMKRLKKWAKVSSPPYFLLFKKGVLKCKTGKSRKMEIYIKGEVIERVKINLMESKA